jgi:hypothetical protein
MSPSEVRSAGERFRSVPFPRECMGEDVAGVCLASADTFLAGCISYFVTTGTLDAERIAVVVRTCAELERALPHLSGAAHSYFSSLVALGTAVKHQVYAG